MRRLTILILAFFLTACGADTGENGAENKKGVNENNSSTEIQDKFKLELKSEKPRYMVGEELKITAELTYMGEEEIEIGHGGSWLYFNTTNVTKGYQFKGAMDQPYIVTPMKPNEPIIVQYRFSGGTYFKESGGTPYTDEEFKQMASMNFPPGEYKIEGITDFRIDGEEQKYELEADIVFEIVD